jgi:hypothetical protein
MNIYAVTAKNIKMLKKKSTSLFYQKYSLFTSKDSEKTKMTQKPKN